MPAVPFKTRSQFNAALEKALTEPLNGQNTARKVKDVFKDLGANWFNKAEDKLSVEDISGLERLFAQFGQAKRITRAALSAAQDEEALTAGVLYIVTDGTNFVCVPAVLENKLNLAEAVELTPQGIELVSYDLTDGSTAPRSGGSSARFTITPTESDGGIQAGQTYTNVSSEELWRLKLVRYQTPVFTFFLVAGQGSQDVEVGTSFPAGFKSFTWGTNNSQNVTTGSISLRDETANTTLATGEANDGSLSASTASLTAAAGEFRRYRLYGQNTQSGSFTADVVYNGYYRVFYGPGAATTSAQVRALSSHLSNATNQFTLNTGTAATVFSLFLPPGKSLSSVIDLDALNKDITAEYVAGGQSVNNAAGAPVAYTSRVKTQAVPYSTNHRHLVTLS